ncbi:MAG TPA: tetratricopeptide repeat protein, partial [Gemmataceae bacterium]|nr:tetratricopeptide repeat protein [Gemmataceae bacterium]
MGPRRFNTRFFLVTLIVCVAVAGFMHWLHGRQLGTHVRAFLDEAGRAEEKGELEQAAIWFREYLQVVPGDLDARERYARVLAHEGTRASLTSALNQMERVLREAPGRTALRWEVARLALQMRDYPRAQAQYDALPKAAQESGAGCWLHGQCEVKASQETDKLKLANAIKDLKAALNKGQLDATLTATDPQQQAAVIDCSVLLADVYRRLQQQKNADECMDDLTKKQPTVAAYLARASYWEKTSHKDKLHRAGQDIGEAERLAKANAKEAERLAKANPKEAERLTKDNAKDQAKIRLASAKLAYQQGKRQRALEELRKGLEGDQLKGLPEEPVFYRSLAALEIELGNLKEAAEYRRRLLADRDVHATADDLWYLVDVLIDLRELKGNQGAETLLGKLGNTGLPPERIDYLWGKLRWRQHQWAEARQKLEAAAPRLAENPSLHFKNQWLLGQCYQQLGYLDNAIAAYREALAIEPKADDVRRALVGALVSAGHLTEAVDAYRMPRPTVADVLAQAQLRLQLNLSLPERKRDWMSLNERLSQLRKQLPNVAEVLVLQADVLLASDPSPQTRTKVLELLKKARDTNRKQFALWLPLIRLAEREGNLPQADQFLKEARHETGDSVDWRLAQAALILQREKKENVSRQLAPLEQNIDHFTSADQARLLEGLAADYAAVQDGVETVRLVGKLRERWPEDVPLLTRLFDLTLQTDRLDEAEQLVGALHYLEGEAGDFWRLANGSLQLARAHKGDQNALTRARQQAEELSKRRPDWARVRLLQAQVADLDQKPDEALQHYLEAVDRGERGPQFLRRLVTLLYERGRFDDASKVLEQFPDALLAASGLGRIAVDVALHVNHADQAVRLAPLAVAPNSKDYRDQLWLGVVLAKAGRTADAEKAFRQAVVLAPDKGETHIVLVTFYAGTKQRDKARAAIRHAEDVLPPPAAPLVLARCYESLGDTTTALAQLQKAFREQPHNPQVLRALASFYLDHQDFANADPLLTKLLEPANQAEARDVAWARRWLAVDLASRPGSGPDQL